MNSSQLILQVIFKLVIERSQIVKNYITLVTFSKHDEPSNYVFIIINASHSIFTFNISSILKIKFFLIFERSYFYFVARIFKDISHLINEMTLGIMTATFSIFLCLFSSGNVIPSGYFLLVAAE